MRATYTQATDFQQERDFGQKINATFEFIGAHFRPLGRCLLYFVLPSTLLTGVGLGIMTNTMGNVMGASIQHKANTTASDLLTPAYFSGIGLAMVAGLLSFLLMMSTLYAYIRLVVRTETVPAPAQVWQEMKGGIGRMLLAFGLLLVLYIALFGLTTGLTALSPMFGIVLLVLGLLSMYAAIPVSLYFPVLWLEEGTVWQALRRCFFLVQGKWWSTFGLLFVASIIQGMIAILFALPQYGVLAGKMLKIPGLDSDLFGIVAQCLYALGLMFTYVIPLTALVFQYFNLMERKEGRGLRTLLDGLGQSPTPVAYNHAYRPDEEGEY